MAGWHDVIVQILLRGLLICSEHSPSVDGISLHAAACHACLFVPETSCERGNRYLGRSVVVPTFAHDDFAFFDLQ